MYKVIILIALILVCEITYCQNLTLSGSVYDNRKVPLEGAIVSLFKDTSLSDVLAYTLSDAKGAFSLKVETQLKLISIQVSSLGFKTFVGNVSLPFREKIQIILSDDTVELQEVVVKVAKIKDTVGVDRANMNLTENSTLRDILNQANGFMITKEGGISYNGIPINKVLINKKEVFINQNKIALDNLNNEIIDSLQVINNYRDKFNLNFNNFTSTVININTKKEFSGVVKTGLNGAYGLKNAYQIKPKSLFFSDKVNLFATVDINNIGEKDFSNDDILAPLIEKTNSYTRSLIIPFFIDDDLLKMDRTTSFSVTSRHQGEKSKTGLIIQYNRISKVKETFSTGRLINLNTLAKQEQNSLSDASRFYTINYYLNKLISSRIGTSYHFDLLSTNDNRSSDLNVINYFPDTNYLTGITQKRPKGFILSNLIDITALFGKKVLLKSELNYYKQNSDYNLLSNYSINDSSTRLKQNISFRSDVAMVNFSTRYIINELMALELKPQFNLHQDRNLELVDKQRRFFHFVSMLAISGQKRKTNYVVQIAPEYYSFVDIHKKKNILNIEANFDQKLTSSSLLTIRIQNKNSPVDFYYFIDTLQNSYNSKTITKDIPYDNIVTTKTLNGGYYYTNIVKSTSFSTSVTLSDEKNSLQSYFQSIDSNSVYYYRNVIVPFRKAMDIRSAAGKSYYISRSNHKLSFKISAGYNRTTMPFYNFVSPQSLSYRSSDITYGSQVSFQYNSKFVTEVKVIYNSSFRTISLQGEKFKYFSDYLGFEVFSHNDKIEMKSAFYYLKNHNATYNFNAPLLNFSASFKINDKILAFVNGKALLDLFNLRKQPFTAYDVSTQGVLLNEYFNKYRISNLIFGLNYKI